MALASRVACGCPAMVLRPRASPNPFFAAPRYTAKGPNTCAGFAASCNHEAQDALQWASWGAWVPQYQLLVNGAHALRAGIDYVKDDSCSQCGSRTDDDLYHSMWAAIEVR